MLILTRKTGQKLIISNNIEVTVLEIKGDSIKLGIQAPRDVSVYRQEIYDAIKKANQSATQSFQADALDQVYNLIEPQSSTDKE